MSIDNVQDITPRVQYVATAGQTEFPYPFPIFDEDDLRVYVDGTLQTKTTDYTVSGVGNDNGGTVTFTSALSGDEVVTIYRETEIARTTDFQQNGPWRSTSTNDELDRITVILQELKAEIGRCLRFPKIATVASDAIELGPIANWLGRYIYINSSGQPEPAVISETTVTQSIIGSLLYPQTTAESNAGVTPVNYAYPPGHLYRYASNLATLGDGTGDDTVAWQRMLAFPGRKYVPRPASKYKVDPLEIISNTWIEMEAGTTITANEGYGVDRGVFNLSDGVSNIVIRGNGSTIDMEWTYTTGEDKFCLALWEATNVWVDGMTFRRGVDGIYVGFHPAHSENVWITNFRCELNRRNGISVTSARNAWFVNGVLSENGTTHGTNPKAGIDIEPNGNAGVGSTMDSEIDGIYVVNVKSSGNGNHDFMIAGQNLDTGGKKISVHIIDCEGDSAGDSSLLTDNWLPGASGGVFVRNYIARNAGANSFAQRSSALPVLIDGLRSIDPNQGDQASDHFGAHVAIYGHNTTDGSTYGNVTIRNAFGRGSSARKTVALALVNEPNSIIRDIDIEIDTDAAATKRYSVGGSASNSAGKRRVRFTDLTDIAVTSNIAAASMPAYAWNTVSNSGASSNLTHNLSDPGMRVDGTEIGFRCVAGFNMTLNPGTGWTIGGGAFLQTRQPGAYVRVRANATTQSWEVIEGGDGWSPTPISFTSGDATPSVAAGRIFITANAVPTTISAFDDGSSKEIVVLIGDDNTTIDFTGTTLKGNGGVDWTPANGDMMRCVHDGTNWRCQVIDCTA